MASLHFVYASMNAGKSTQLLQVAHNYEERGQKAVIMKPSIDNRDGEGEIVSRIGIRKPCFTFGRDENLVHFLFQHCAENKPDAVLVDECQFLTLKQVKQLCTLVDVYEIPVLCYGLRTDFQGNLFEGSNALMALADKLRELKGICHCGKKATMVLRLDSDGNVVRDGEQVQIGGNDRYVAVCRKHFVLGEIK